MNTIQTLQDFVNTAETNRVYPANSVYGYKAALKLFASELNQQEAESLDLFKSRFEQIYQSVFNKNKAKISIASLETYKRRLRGLLNDYEKYAHDPAKMAQWNRGKGKSFTKNSAEKEKLKKDASPEKEPLFVPEKSIKMNRMEIALRPDTTAIILVPFDLSQQEADKLKKFIDASIV